MIPLTCKKAEYLATPALFFAAQTYSPRWKSWTESILSCVMRLLVRVIVIPFILSITLPLNVHFIPMGTSPLFTVQKTLTISPELIGSSPKSKGAIWGGTARYKDY